MMVLLPTYLRVRAQPNSLTYAQIVTIMLIVGRTRASARSLTGLLTPKQLREKYRSLRAGTWKIM